MEEIEEIPTIFAEEPPAPSAPPRKLAPLREGRLKPLSPPGPSPGRESWAENVDAPKASRSRARRNSGWVQDEGEPQKTPSPLPTEPPKPEGSFVSDNSDDIKSPTPSQTSKRTSASGELSAQIRHKIREQARSVVAKKRGSVQLARRLSRQQTQMTVDETYSEDQEEQIDVEIEKSIALGEKYTSEDASQEQNAFFEGEPPSEDVEKGAKKDKRRPLVSFVKAFPPTVSQRLLHNSLIRTYSKNPEFAEARLPSAESSFFVARPLRDWNLAKQRFGTDFIDTYGFLKGTELMRTRIPLRVEREDDRGLLQRAGLSRWGESAAFDRRRLHQLELRVERVLFDRHWLFSAEDLLASDIRRLHEVQKATGDRVIRLLKEFLAQKKRVLGTSDEATKTLLQGDVERLWRELEEEQRIYARLGDSIEAKWLELCALRESNGAATTTLNLDKTFLKPEGFSDADMELFYRTPVYSLSETHPLPEERSLPEKLRLDAIHFNGIPVCKTRSRTLSADFSVDFEQIYSLEVHDSPGSISLTLLERSQNSEYKELARVGVPLPDHDQRVSPETPLEAVEFASRRPPSKTKNPGVPGATEEVHGRVFCSAAWTEKGLLAAHEKKEYSQGRSSCEFDGFHLIPRETRLVSDEEFRSDLRIEALVARSEGRLRGPKALRIPLHSAEMDPQLLLEGEAGRSAPNGGRRWHLAIDVTRQEGKQRALDIRNQLKERLSKDKRRIRHEDLVREEAIPTVFGAFGSLFGQADTSRRLKPMRKTPTSFQPTTQGAELNLVLHVQTALNVPSRADSSETQSLVCVEWRDTTVQTTVAKGANPSWNETLKLTVPPSEPLEEEPLVFRLYDQRVATLDSDERETHTVHEQLRREWLGTLELSLAPLRASGKLEGTLRLRTPLLSTNHKEQEKPVYLKVLVAFDPVPAPPSSEALACIESSESDAVLAQCRLWTQQSRAAFPERDFVSTVTDVGGRSTLLCRFLRAIRPPPGVEQLAGNLERAVLLATRIAGCISSLSDLPSTTRIVGPADQLISCGFGTPLEKATLLACWMLHLQVEPVLLVGRALPEGAEAAFVLVRVADLRLLLNPNDGFSYRLGDPLAPLLSVATAIVAENHFANLQTAQHPSQLSFDLGNSSRWRPLFPSPPRSELVSVQGSFLAYLPVPEDVLVELRASLEREIKVHFDAARRCGVPQWNLAAARTLREMLVEWEARAAPPPDLESRLLRGAFRSAVVAFALPYRSREDVFRTVAATRLSEGVDRGAHFAVAVHVTPFFGGVLQVAVALAALQPR
uniref:C2 domain-containing protein n=1 Tax=Steinernema glaseri TaxID=37863 RepID=A0A1I7Z9T7_9BILA